MKVGELWRLKRHNEKTLLIEAEKLRLPAMAIQVEIVSVFAENVEFKDTDPSGYQTIWDRKSFVTVYNKDYNASR